MVYKAIHTVNLNVSPTQAWDNLKDLSLAPCYVPGVDSVEFLTESREGPGTVRRVFPRGMDETVESWVPGREVLLKLTKKGSERFFPFNRASFRYSISETGGTFMQLSLEYEPVLGKVGHFLLGGIIDRRIERTALSLQHFYNEKSA